MNEKLFFLPSSTSTTTSNWVGIGINIVQVHPPIHRASSDKLQLQTRLNLIWAWHSSAPACFWSTLHLYCKYLFKAFIIDEWWCEYSLAESLGWPWICDCSVYSIVRSGLMGNYMWLCCSNAIWLCVDWLLPAQVVVVVGVVIKGLDHVKYG